MAQIFPIDFEEKLTMAQDDYILFSDSEDGNKIKKAQYSNLKGEKGDTGTAATITVGSTTTGAAGSSASVTNSGTSSAAVLDFTIPKGDKGDTGQTGPAIVSAAFNGNDIDFTEEDGNVVTLTDAKIDLKGDAGDAATISVGTTSTLSPGSSATVTNSGTSSAAVFNFGIPKGDKGDTGDTGAAATISVGTTTTGDAGTSASVTNSGTSSAAVFNFTIPKGDKGDTGSTGAAATITAGTTTTLSPGSSATVTNSGTSSAAVFNFGIPQGATGATGNGISTITETTSGKVHTITITETDGDTTVFTVSDGADGEGAGDVIGPNSAVDGNVALFDGNTGKLIKDGGALPSVINNLTSVSTTDALSAAQGKALKDAIDNISGLGKFLSLWNSATGQPISFPLATPYAYTTGDRFMVETVGTTNYKPNGSSYTGSASTTVETETVEQGDVYIYDGTTWLLQKNTAVEVSFSAIAGQPTDNAALSTALGNKQDKLVSGTNIKTVNSTSLLGSGNVAVQETLVSGTNIKTVNSTSLLGSGNIAVQPTLVSGTNIKTINSNSLLGSGNLSLNEVPSGGNNGDVLTNVSGTPTWQAPSGGDVKVSSQSGNILTSGMKIWAGTEADYGNLGTYDSNCLYLTI